MGFHICCGFGGFDSEEQGILFNTLTIGNMQLHKACFWFVGI